MAKYVVKRTILAIITIILISAITFFAMYAVPGGPFDSEKAMIGSMTFSSSCPASAAIVMVTSLPMMSKATCETLRG